MRHLVMLAVAAFVCACAQETPTAPEAPAQDRASIALEGLIMPADTAGRLTGELGCSFMAGEELLVAGLGFVDPASTAEALVKNNGTVVHMTATAIGGFEGMVDGDTFAAEGLSVEVRPGAENATGTEAVQHNATLIVRDASSERTYEGAWSCGP